MKISTTLKSIFLVLLFALSSCATTKYGEDTARNNYSNLQTGKNYAFKMRNGGETQKMIFSRISEGQIIGFLNKKDSTQVAIPASDVSEVKDLRKAKATITGVAIGTVAAAALIISASKAD